MRFGISVLCVLLLTSCAITTEQYYVPADPALVSEGKACGYVPWGNAVVPLADQLSVSVSILPNEGRLSAGLQLSLREGSAVQFLGSELRFSDPASGRAYVAPLSEWSTGVRGRDDRPGHVETFPPDARLEWRRRNADLVTDDMGYLAFELFMAHARVEAPPLDELVMTFPSVEVNGIAIAPQDIPLRKVKKKGVMLCIQ